MVAAAPQSTQDLPPLSRDDELTLTAYICQQFNLIALTLHLKRPLLSLARWAAQPHIQAHVKLYQDLQLLHHQAETAAARSAGIAHLIDIVNTTKDPIERRRAAQTLIRVGSEKPLPEGGVGVGSRVNRHSQNGRSRGSFAHTDPSHHESPAAR